MDAIDWTPSTLLTISDPLSFRCVTQFPSYAARQKGTHSLPMPSSANLPITQHSSFTLAPNQVLRGVSSHTSIPPPRSGCRYAISAGRVSWAYLTQT